MSSSTVIIENRPSTNGQISSTNNKLNELYLTYEAHSPSPNLSHLSSRNSSPSSSSSSSRSLSNNLPSKMNSDSSMSSNHRKESTLKLPYPVLSDHRDPSSILVLLQKETQTTSKKITDVTKQIETCEQRLTLNIYTDNEKKTLKYERVKLKQQLDALKKHERRVNLQIDFITTKTEIKGLEDEQKQMDINQNADEHQQMKILSGKLKQKLDKMKVYMRQRNEQMKKISNGKQRLNNSNDQRKSTLTSSQKQQRLNSTAKDSNRKRSSTSSDNTLSDKRLKSTAPVVRLSSKVTTHDLKKHLVPPPIVRFINKTTESTINSTSPTTPASSSSTLSPPLLASTSTGDVNLTKTSLQQIKAPSLAAVADDDEDDDDDDELNLELNIDELFNDDTYSEQTVQRSKNGMDELKCQVPVKQEISKKEF